MLIQIQDVQIPKFWEIIKYSALQSDNVEEKDYNEYCLNLLQDLLGSNKVCFVKTEEDKITFVLIIEIRFNSVRNLKSVYISNLYSFKVQSSATWMNIEKDLTAYAKKQSCYIIETESSNDNIIGIFKHMNVDCVSRKFSKYIGE